jgi:uncharacterized protein YhaN
VAVEAERRERAAAEELAARERDAGPALETDARLDDRLAAAEELDALRVRRAVAEARAGGTMPAPVAGAAALAVGVAGIAVGAAVGQPLLGLVIGLAAALGFGAVAWRAGRGPDLSALDAERRTLLERVGLPSDAGDAAVRSLAAELGAIRTRAGRAADERAALAARRAELERRREEAAAARDALAAAEDAWRRWLRDAALSDGLSPEAARHVLGAAGIARRAANERDHQRALLAAYDRDLDAFSARVDELARALGQAPPADAARREAFVIGAADRLEAAREAERRAAALDATIDRLEAARQAAAATVRARDAALAAHLEATASANAEALRARARAAAERRSLDARARELRAHLAGVAGGGDGVDALVADALAADPAQLEASLADAVAQVERLEDEEREVLNRIGALDARIRQLEAAEELGARRQELASLEGRAAALAREWAVRALALRLLTETRSRYERERQPDVVRAATGHFERITDGRYARVVAPPGEGEVRVETEGGEARTTDELSRGTAEQLYLALRFGLIEEFARTAEPLPVVMDDILVNFDAERATRAAAAIRDLAERHQVLYFTCHRQVATLLDPAGDRTLALG